VLVSVPRIVYAAHPDRRRFWVRAVSAAVGLVLILGVSHYVGHGNEPLVWMLERGR